MSNDKVLKKLDDNYRLIPMNEITDEARALAVRWVEGYEPMGDINLEQKHKLASDIMNYAEAHAKLFAVFAAERYGHVRGDKWDGDMDESSTTNSIYEEFKEHLKKKVTP